MSTEEQLKVLIKKRGAVKGKLTTLNNLVSKIKLAQQSGSPIDEVDKVQLEDRILKNQNLLEESFEPVQIEIECLCDKYDEQFAIRGEVEDSYFKVMAEAKLLLSKISSELNLNQAIDEERLSPASSRANSVSNVSNRSYTGQSSNVKLPDIKLPSFNGTHESWLEFRDLFTSLIHKNTDIREIQKFHYLRASLEGTAAQVISSLEFSADNYETAWSLVCKRFENTKLLIHNHVEALFSLGKLNKGSANSANVRKLIDTVKKHIMALNSLKMPTDQWDILVMHIVAKSLDESSMAKWEEFKFNKDNLTLENMFEFLKNRADLLERLELNKMEKNSFSELKGKGRSLLSANQSERDDLKFKKCSVCSAEHSVHQCEKFQSLSVVERYEQAKKLKLCLRCLRPGHIIKVCRLYGSCKVCHSKNHNTLLHKNDDRNNSSANDEKEHSSGDIDNSNKLTTFCSSTAIENSQVLLSTAVVNVLDSSGKWTPIRAILDSASQSSYITEKICNKLKLNKQKIEFSVCGLNNTKSKINYKCEINLSSRHHKFQTKLTCLVVPEITGNLPVVPVNIKKWSTLKDFKLADDCFYKPGPIDCLIGADLFWNLLCSKQYSLGLNNPVLQETLLGWIVSGKLSDVTQFNKTYCNFSKVDANENNEVQEQLAQFFEIESVSNKGQWSNEELECEAHFVKNTIRLKDGRFQVSIPFKGQVNTLGESREQATRRFYSLEKKFSQNDNFKRLYSEFLDSYDKLGQIRKISLENSNLHSGYYLPHHGVLREHSTSTKLRVVFDASARTSSGISLNDLQMKGPVIQDDLLAILLRFRQHAYVVTADIEKMYRQVRVSPDQRHLQRILWRSNRNEQLSEYELSTVTFGMTSSPFLAIRCLVELAREVVKDKPKIAEIIEHDFYVDDLITGFDDLKTAKNSCSEISNILASGCFPLRKWQSNNVEVLQDLNVTGCIDQPDERSFGDDEVVKTLGLVWHSKADELAYKIDLSDKRNTITKRTMLSSIAKLFDPLGLLSPVIITAKIMLQQLWQEGLSWDASVPYYLQRQWQRLMEEMVYLNKLKIQRHAVCRNPVRVELHAFSDASETAYGACIYICSTNEKGERISRLLCSKTKVSPIKPLTIPKLELCAAHVLAKLVTKVVSAFRMKFDAFYYWTDSNIILGWIRMSANLLKPFVRNRIAEIQELTSPSDWRYVSTKENPADLLSRGVSPKDILTLGLWWHGPDWLINDIEIIFDRDKCANDIVELPEVKSTVLVSFKSLEFPFERFSSLTRCQRTIAYMLRFKTNCLTRPENRLHGILTCREIKIAVQVLVKISQIMVFIEEYRQLETGQSLDRTSKLLSLNPFLDADGIMRVGGRLTNTDFPYDKRHPMILSSKNHVAKLIIKAEHELLMHAGPQQTLFSVREKFWIISGKNLAKLVVHECLKCYRFKGKTIQPIMGNLPKDRFSRDFPFQVTGIDYAGPFLILNKRGKGARLLKGYVCLFVCFATKALHLELVSDLSTDIFILALKRFISRRGKPAHLYSDNGSNFVGASRKFSELQAFFKANKEAINDFVNNQGINWSFIPTYAPHFGGLWEAGVRQVKYHLKRVLGNAHCTNEEFATLLCQIEAILNSRPLSPLSDDPSDPLPLTPAHFLTGRPASSIMEPSLSHLKESHLSRYQRLEQLRQQFWARWSKEYVSDLQQRTKWKSNYGTLTQGALVLIKEDRVPPLNWRLGRITRLFPGKDNIVRVCEIKTSSGVIIRDFSKICPLPGLDSLN